MSAPNLTIATRQLNGTSVLDIGGDVTATAEDAMMAAYITVSNPRTRAIVLNFSELEYMNSGGIGMLVTLLVRTSRQHQRLLAYGLSEHYRRIFELTQLDEAISIHDSEAHALAVAAAG